MLMFRLMSTQPSTNTLEESEGVYKLLGFTKDGKLRIQQVGKPEGPVKEVARSEILQVQVVQADDAARDPTAKVQIRALVDDKLKGPIIELTRAQLDTLLGRDVDAHFDPEGDGYPEKDCLLDD